MKRKPVVVEVREAFKCIVEPGDKFTAPGGLKDGDATYYVKLKLDGKNADFKLVKYKAYEEQECGS